MTQMSLPRNPEQKGLIPGRALPGEAIGHREVVVTLELGHSWVGVTGSRDSHWSWGHAGAGVTVEPGSRRSGGHSGAGVPGEWGSQRRGVHRRVGVAVERGSQGDGGSQGSWGRRGAGVTPRPGILPAHFLAATQEAADQLLKGRPQTCVFKAEKALLVEFSVRWQQRTHSTPGTWSEQHHGPWTVDLGRWTAILWAKEENPSLGHPLVRIIVWKSQGRDPEDHQVGGAASSGSTMG